MRSNWESKSEVAVKRSELISLLLTMSAAAVVYSVVFWLLENSIR